MKPNNPKPVKWRKPDPPLKRLPQCKHSGGPGSGSLPCRSKSPRLSRWCPVSPATQKTMSACRREQVGGIVSTDRDRDGRTGRRIGRQADSQTDRQERKKQRNKEQMLRKKWICRTAGENIKQGRKQSLTATAKKNANMGKAI